MTEDEHDVEEWRGVIGSSAMDVSSLGRLRSRFGKNGRPMRHGTKIVRGWSGTQGYRHAWVSYDDGSKRKRKVHHLVLESFVGPRPDGLVCDHINGVVDDNRASNLEWVTHQENTRRAHATGLASTLAAAKANIKLDKGRIEDLLTMRAEGMSQRQIAKQLGVTQGQVWLILNGKSRSDVTGFTETERERNGLAAVADELANSDVIAIRDMLYSGASQRQAAKEFGVSQGTVSHVHLRRGRYANV